MKSDDKLLEVIDFEAKRLLEWVKFLERIMVENPNSYDLKILNIYFFIENKLSSLQRELIKLERNKE